MRRILWTLLLAVCAAPLWAQGGTIGGTPGPAGPGVTYPLAVANGSAAAPSIGFANSTTTGIYRFGVDTIGFATGGVSTLQISGGVTAKIVGGAGSMTIQAGTGNSRNLVLNFTSTNGTVKSAFQATSNSATVQTVKLFADTLQLLSNDGSASPSAIRGGAGSMTLIAGSGNSRQFTAQTTTSGGTATTFLRANEIQQTLFASGAAATPGIGFAADTIMGLSQVGTAGASDSIRVSVNGIAQMKIGAAGVLLLPVLPAEGSTKNAMCWDGTTFNVTQNAAATCTVSSRRFKTNIRAVPLDTARAIVDALHASMYDEKVGGRKAFGIIAEEADSANHRLASRDSKGLVTSTNYEEISAILLTIVKDQQRQLDSLKTVLRRARP